MKYFNSIGAKVSIPIITSTILFLLGIIIINNSLFIKQGKNETKNYLKNKIKQINKSLESIENKALWVSSSFANLNFVKKAYKQFYETDSLQQSSLIIENQLTKINSTILNNTNEEAKIHFHLPPARSFIRCWSAKRGDDISAFRNTVLEVSENHLPVTGIEVGRGGFVIRGIVPIFDDENNYLGSVESLFPISSIVESAKLSENEEFAIFMDTDLLNIATNFLEKTSSNVTDDKPTIGKLILVQKTSSNFYINELPEKKLNNALNDTIFYQKDSLQYVMFPIKNFAGKNEGVGVIQLNRNELLKLINKAKTINLIIGLIFIFLLVALILFFVKIFITKPITKVVNAMKRISKKQINFQIKEQRKDEIGELYKSINEINTNFKEILLNISGTATAVSDASKQLSTASQQISEQASEQASTTEEIASSMEQILAMINSNTQNAEITGKTSKKSANEMQESNDFFVQTIKSVSEISEKISIITEIANKTDILSINAAIEAARAGEAGKGFAVVANEIRKLADKTKMASDEITELSRNGQDISKNAGKKLSKTIPEIIKSAKLVNNIVSASREQQRGVEMINTSIQQLTETTNENATSSEEMSASAEELSAQAEQLKELISVFKIGNVEDEKIAQNRIA